MNYDPFEFLYGWPEKSGEKRRGREVGGGGVGEGGRYSSEREMEVREE